MPCVYLDGLEPLFLFLLSLCMYVYLLCSLLAEPSLDTETQCMCVLVLPSRSGVPLSPCDTTACPASLWLAGND